MSEMSTEPPGGGDSGAPRPFAATLELTIGGARDLAPGDDVGGYRIEHVIGEGGMGTVYGAIHPLIGKRAAIKVLRRELCSSAEAVERFVQEARAVNQIGHPNIVDAFAFGTLPDGRSWCAMEWLTGESLADRIERRRLPWAEACGVLLDVIRALEAAHKHGVVHRDLKPDNVFLVEQKDDRPRVKLLDFGIAKLTGGADQRIERTRTGALVGTPLYIAPEQARGQAVDAHTDIYSLGVMTFELLAGRLPFDADNAADLIAKHLTETPPRLRSITPGAPAAVDDVIAEMLAKEPARRPTLARVKQVLVEAAGADPALSIDAPPTVPAKPGAAVRFAPKDEPALELAISPEEVRAARARPTRNSAPPPMARSRGLLVPIVLAGLAAAGAVAYLALRGRGDHAARAPGPSIVVDGSATPVEIDRASDGATLDVTLAGASHATITIDGGSDGELRAGPPAMIPIAAGHHEITVRAAGSRTFHTSIDAARGARVAVIAHLEAPR
jgi:serine/threonine-protein kinase